MIPRVPCILSLCLCVCVSLSLSLCDRVPRVRDVSFFMRWGCLKILWGGGGHIFCEPKKERGGGHGFFPEFNNK